MNLCAVALVKQDRENDLFHISRLEDGVEGQPNGLQNARLLA